MKDIGRVLDFWFGAPEGPEFGRKRKSWFGKDPAFDEEIRRNFGGLHERAAQGALDGWMATARGCMALIVVLDQFSRNLYRDSPGAFACDARARAAARHAIDRGFDREFPPGLRAFFYLPFEHSEDLGDQRLSVDLARGNDPHDGKDEWIDYAVRHHVVIERFGRFPHRNTVLGRETTPEEAAFLKRNEKGF